MRERGEGGEGGGREVYNRLFHLCKKFKCKCQCSQFTPLSNKPVSTSPLSQTPREQLQPTQITTTCLLKTQYQPSLRSISLNKINMSLNKRNNPNSYRMEFHMICTTQRKPLTALYIRSLICFRLYLSQLFTSC